MHPTKLRTPHPTRLHTSRPTKAPKTSHPTRMPNSPPVVTPAPTPAPTYSPSPAPTYAPTAAPSSADVLTCGDYYYQFQNPSDDTFQLPPAQPATGATDTVLNVDNPIVTADGSAIEFACNSGNVAYLDKETGTFIDSYVGEDGQEHSLDHQFYATNGADLMAAVIQEYSNPAMLELFCNTEIRLELNCNNGQLGCINFYVIPDPSDLVCP